MENFLQKCRVYFATWKMRVLFALSLFVLVFAFFAPVKIGENVNQNVFLIGKIEENNKEINNSLGRVSSVYAAVKLASIVPKTFEDAGALGIKAGAALKPVVDQLDSVASVLFVSLMVLFAQKFLMGFTSYLAIKIFLPAGVLMYWLGGFLDGRSLQRIGRFLIQLGILVLLFVPTTGYINHKIIENSKMEQRVQEIEILDKDLKIQAEVPEISQESEDIKNPSQQKGVWERTKEVGNWLLGLPKQAMKATKKFVWKAKEQIEVASGLIGKMLNQVMETITLFVLTGIFVPIGVCFIFWAIFRVINIPDMQDFVKDIEKVVNGKNGKKNQEYFD